MSKKDVDVSRRWTGPFGPMETRIRDKQSKKTYTGYGWDTKQADKAAGDKKRRGKADK